MPVAWDAAGSGAVAVNSTTFTVDITSAATGSGVFLWVAWGTDTGPTAPGWTVVASGTVGPCVATLFYRTKISGDTTFTLTAIDAKGSHAWVSYTGLSPAVPYQAVTAANLFEKGVSNTTAPGPAITNTDPAAWAMGAYAVRVGTSTFKAITWTPPAELIERADQNNSAATTATWLGVELADSGGPVTAGDHQYTATMSSSQLSAVGGLIYLNPAPAGGGPPGAGVASGTTTWAGTASGARASRGTAAGTTLWAGTAAGVRPGVALKSGTATGTTAWVGAASGRTTRAGTTTGTTTWVGSATGSSGLVVLRDITLVATLGPRRWAATLEPRRWEGHLL